MVQRSLNSHHHKRTTAEHIVLLIELIAAFQKIPQRYCSSCKAKTRLGIEAARQKLTLSANVMLRSSRIDEINAVSV